MSHAVKHPTIGGHSVTMGELRDHVINRDGVCLGWMFDPDHLCHDQWGQAHDPHDKRKLTLEHVPRVHGHLEGRVDDERHCVTLCHGLNVGGPPAELRDWLRVLLAKWYPKAHEEK